MTLQAVYRDQAQPPTLASCTSCVSSHSLRRYFQVVDHAESSSLTMAVNSTCFWGVAPELGLNDRIWRQFAEHLTLTAEAETLKFTPIGQDGKPQTPIVATVTCR